MASDSRQVANHRQANQCAPTARKAATRVIVLRRLKSTGVTQQKAGVSSGLTLARGCRHEDHKKLRDELRNIVVVHRLPQAKKYHGPVKFWEKLERGMMSSRMYVNPPSPWAACDAVLLLELWGWPSNQRTRKIHRW